MLGMSFFSSGLAHPFKEPDTESLLDAPCCCAGHANL